MEHQLYISLKLSDVKEHDEMVFQQLHAAQR